MRDLITRIQEMDSATMCRMAQALDFRKNESIGQATKQLRRSCHFPRRRKSISKKNNRKSIIIRNVL
jgi:hypothetical protein